MSEMLEINAETGQSIERDYTDIEMNVLNDMINNIPEQMLNQLNQTPEEDINKASAIIKLQALGLTEEEAKAIAGI
jgi:hypothetical protein